MLIVNAFKLPPSETPEIVLDANLVIAIEPASMVLVTDPVSPVVTTVPVVAGSVNTVPVPAIAVEIICTDPLVIPGKVTEEIPVNAKLALTVLSVIGVVPI